MSSIRILPVLVEGNWKELQVLQGLKRSSGSVINAKINILKI